MPRRSELTRALSGKNALDFEDEDKEDEEDEDEDDDEKEKEKKLKYHNTFSIDSS